MASDELNTRLRAARPHEADVGPEAFDGVLLARARAQGDVVDPRPRRAVPRAAVPVAAAGVTFAVAGVVMFAGGPSGTGGPTPAEAITQQTLRWLDPAAGTVLHVRSTETDGDRATTREFWQSADHPDQARTAVDVPGPDDYELSGDVLYDVAANTIYDVAPAKQPADDGAPQRDAKAGGVEKARGAKRVDALQARADGPARRQAPIGTAPSGPKAMVGDPVVGKVRTLLQDGVMSVEGREAHDGIETWKVTLTETKGRQPWTLWVDAADGKPVELYDPGRAAGDPAQTIRWSAYDVLPTDDASRAALSILAAHPGATVSHDAAAAAAARERLVAPQDG